MMLCLNYPFGQVHLATNKSSYLFFISLILMAYVLFFAITKKISTRKPLELMIGS
jgi:hypothetical protein